MNDRISPVREYLALIEKLAARMAADVENVPSAMSGHTTPDARLTTQRKWGRDGDGRQKSRPGRAKDGASRSWC